MATTTNFGWETPDDTDLVKDGAAAIRTLGGAIDTSLVDLKGGTTGQVLSKASNTDMDFTWTSANPGDIEGVTAGAGLSGGGTSGTVTLNLNALSAGRNAAINGGMDIWQRGTSFSVSGFSAYTADRWLFASGSNTGRTVSRQATGDTTNLPDIQYCIRVQRNSGNTSAQQEQISQSLESVNSIPFAGKTVVLSFWARKGADYSATSSALSAQLYSGTGTDQNINGTYTGSATLINQTATLTTTWQRFSYSATVGSTATELAIRFSGTTVGTASTNDYYEVTGVQLELGSSATSFSRAGGTIQGELAACQRYFQVFGTGQNQYEAIAMLSSGSTSLNSGVLQFLVPMRTAPSLSVSSVTHFEVALPGTKQVETTAISIAANTAGNQSIQLNATITTDAAYGANKSVLLETKSTSARLNLSSEL